jgi:hypothetical protein
MLNNRYHHVFKKGFLGSVVSEIQGITYFFINSINLLVTFNNFISSTAVRRTII